MKSPFPGMDPYLERHWRDVHASLAVYARDWLQERLPSGLRARIEERVFVESPWSTNATDVVAMTTSTTTSIPSRR